MQEVTNQIKLGVGRTVQFIMRCMNCVCVCDGVCIMCGFTSFNITTTDIIDSIGNTVVCALAIIINIFCWCRAREYESMMGETNYNSNKSILMMIIWNGTTLTHAINLQDYGSVHDDSVSLGRTSVQESVNAIKPINASHHYPHLFSFLSSLYHIFWRDMQTD